MAETLQERARHLASSFGSDMSVCLTTLDQCAAALDAKDAEIARLRALVESTYAEAYDAGHRAAHPNGYRAVSAGDAQLIVMAVNRYVEAQGDDAELAGRDHYAARLAEAEAEAQRLWDQLDPMTPEQFALEAQATANFNAVKVGQTSFAGLAGAAYSWVCDCGKTVPSESCVCGRGC